MFGAAVAEETPLGTLVADSIEIEGVGEDGFAGAVGLGDFGPGFIGDEGGAVEGHFAGFSFFRPDAVRGNKGDHVRGGVALHGALPVVARIPVRKLRFVADGGGIEEDFGPAEDEAPGSLGKPLIPADAEADLAELGVPDTEAGVAGVEVVFFLVTDAVGNVRLAVNAEHLAAGVDHGDRVEIGLVVALEKTEGEDDTEFAGEGLEFGDAFVVIDRAGQCEEIRELVLAEIGRLEEFLNEDNVGALGGGSADELLGALEVCGAIGATGHLRGGEGDVSHSRRACGPGDG